MNSFHEKEINRFQFTKTDDQKIIFFSDHLRQEAVDWPMDNYEGRNPTYAVCKEKF